MIGSHAALAEPAEGQFLAEDVRHRVVEADSAGPGAGQHTVLDGAVGAEEIECQRRRPLPQFGEHIAQLGGSPDGFEQYAQDPATRREHDLIVTQAEARGVFGVPSFVFEGELFWGGDRIGLLRERIEQRLQDMVRTPETPR